MKYCVIIMDGASGWPLPELGGRTTLEAASTPNLDRLARHGFVGLAQTIPEGMEPSSAAACMAVLGYAPSRYYTGRGPIEAASMGITLGEGEVAFRCNLVHVADGRMVDYSSGHISSQESRSLIAALQEELGSSSVRFYPGVSYRHICVLNGVPDVLKACCVPPHDIPGQPLETNLPTGPGSEFLLDLMNRSRPILENHPLNLARRERGQVPANMMWLFWGGAAAPELPPFEKLFAIRGALSSGVDLLRGLASLAGLTVLEIPGVTDGTDNDYRAQVEGCLAALEDHDVVVIHVEAPDEAGHAADVQSKMAAIEMIDSQMISRVRKFWPGNTRLLVLSDHATPIAKRTHVADPVPFLMHGPGIPSNGATSFSETEAKRANDALVTSFHKAYLYNFVEGFVKARQIRADRLMKALITAEMDLLGG